MNSGPQQALPDVLAGVLLGTDVGDALGLPAENLSPERIRRRWGGEWRMRLMFGRGMISDDTEHTLMVAQALLSHPDDATTFQRALGWKFRWWFAGLPGGVGLASGQSCLRLWTGFPTSKAAVASAGSGPAMRSSIIGAYFANDEKLRREFGLASSRLTHRGWQAETAALAVAECVALAVQTQGQPETRRVLEVLRQLSEEEEWQTCLLRIEASLGTSISVAEFVRSVGLEKGVTGYSLHVVPVAIYALLRHPGDFRTAMISVLDCGGDTDTVGAILGAMIGANVGKQGIPRDWLAGLCEWPRSITFIDRVAVRLAKQMRAQNPLGPVPYLWPGLIPRNFLFLCVDFAHGFRTACAALLNYDVSSR